MSIGKVIARKQVKSSHGLVTHKLTFKKGTHEINNALPALTSVAKRRKDQKMADQSFDYQEQL